MKLREIGYRGKTAVITGTSTAMFGGSELVTRNGEQTDLLETINWLGKAGLLWAGVRVATIGVAKMSEKLSNENEAKMAELQAGLPTIESPVWPLSIMSRVQQQEKQKVSNSSLTRTFNYTNRAFYSKVEKNSYLAYWSLSQDVENVIEALATEYRNDSRSDDANIAALEMSWILDEVVPVAEDCTKTPQTGDPGKYWFDFIQHQAFDRAGLLFENQLA